MMRATLDTNVFVSALLFGGVPGRILDFHIDEAFVLCTSPAIITELMRVLTERFEWTEDDVEAVLTPIFSRAEIIEPTITVEASNDPDDDRILECAVTSASDALVTGDNDLLRLGTFKGIPIMTPREFVELISGDTPAR